MNQRVETQKNLLAEVKDLRGLRDELGLQAHLFKAEVRKAYDGLENRWRDVEPKLVLLEKASGEHLEEIRSTLRHTIRDLGERYRDIKKSFE